ncbi:MAG: hypothetical protein ACR2G0_05030 [Chthoniobacterales bacterium]
MTNKYIIGNCLLWAAAILASAILHAPVSLTGLLLPALAVGSFVIRPRAA